MEVVEEAVLPVELLCAFVTTANGGPKAGGSDCLIMSMNLAKNQGGSTSALWVSSLSMRKLFLWDLFMGNCAGCPQMPLYFETLKLDNFLTLNIIVCKNEMVGFLVWHVRNLEVYTFYTNNE